MIPTDKGIKQDKIDPRTKLRKALHTVDLWDKLVDVI